MSENIDERIVWDGSRMVLLKEPPTEGTVMVASAGGQTKRVRRTAAHVEFSGKVGPAVRRELPAVDPRNAVVTRSEAAVLLGVDIEQAARLLDEFEIGRHLAFDAGQVKALAARLAEGKGQPFSLKLDPLE